jgi:glycerophosphoryl diester phosphodiesterase
VTLVLAHRGAAGPWAENSLQAFAEAHRLGADGVELDVRLSADGAVVVHHDAEITEVGSIAATPLAELPDYVPLLADALAICDGMVVNVEIKRPPDGPGDAVSMAAADAIAEAGWVEKVVVSSFDASCIEAARAAQPRLPIGWLLSPSADVRHALAEAVDRGYQAVHPFVSDADRALFDDAHEAGLSVNVWTVNTDDDLQTMARYGADAVITDRPGEAVKLLRPA